MPTDTKLIEVDNGVVRLVRRIVEKEVSEEDYTKALAASAPIETGILPEGALMVACKNRTRLIIQQIKPREYRLLWKPHPSQRRQECIVKLPWLQWYGIFVAGSFKAIGVTATTEPITRTDAQVRLPPLPNIFTDRNTICMGEVSFATDADCWTRMSKSVDAVLSSEWNSDLQPDWRALGMMDTAAARAAQSAGDDAAFLKAQGLAYLAKLSTEKPDELWTGRTADCKMFRPITGPANGTMSALVDWYLERHR
ncbi:MAG: hypothetical protein MUC88_20735 [Planctomycetes bacterium]|nr:hypothetical protein [Planctomycetota bacterium]